MPLRPPKSPQRERPLELTRTHLANERTLLAYVRTALALAAAAAALFHLYPAPSVMRAGAWLMALLGALALTLGLWRFVVVRRSMRGPAH